MLLNGGVMAAMVEWRGGILANHRRQFVNMATSYDSTIGHNGVFTCHHFALPSLITLLPYGFTSPNLEFIVFDTSSLENEIFLVEKILYLTSKFLLKCRD